MPTPRGRRSPTPPRRPLTIHDVARAAGCSITTVSWAINGKGAIRPETRARVLQACKDLGYVANSAGRQLRLKRTDTIGLLFPSTAVTLFHNVFYADITAALLEGLAANGLHLLICLYDPADPRHAVPAVIAQGRVDAMALLGTAPRAFIKVLADHRIPLLLLDTTCRGLHVDSVTSAGKAGGAEAVAHLIAAGHRRLAMVVGEVEDANTVDRVAGFHAGLRQSGRAERPAPLRVPLHDYAEAYRRLRTLLAEHEPTGLVMVNDSLASELVRRLQADGVRVPEDISVVSFNDDIDATTCTPPLTTMAIDRLALGRRGAHVLAARLADPDLAVVGERLPMRLIERASVARPGR